MHHHDSLTKTHPVLQLRRESEVLGALTEGTAGMLSMPSPQGVPHVASVHFSHFDDEGVVWLVAGAPGPDLTESTVGSLFVSDARLRAHVYGEVELLVDPDAIQALWRPQWRRWLPKGPEDSRLRLVRLIPTYAEAWSLHGALLLQLAVDTAIDRLTGDGVTTDPTEFTRERFPESRWTGVDPPMPPTRSD